MRLARTLFFVIAVTAMSGFRSDDTFSLKQKFKKDEVATYQLNFNASGEGTEIVFNVKNKYKVLNVEEDGGYEIEETLLDGTVKYNGDEQAMEKEEPKSRKYDKDGKEIKKDDDKDDDEDPISKVVEDVFGFEPDHAVKIGETWDRETTYSTVHATLEGKEKVGDVDCLKVTIKATLSKKDTAGEVVGTFYVRASDFSPEKMEASIDNPKLDAETTMKKIEMKMTRVAD